MRNHLVTLGLALVLAACNGASDDPHKVLGLDHLQGMPGLIPPGSSGNNRGVGGKVTGESCVSSDPNHVCLALKYVSYQTESGQAIISADAAVENVKQINKLWAQCNLGFQIETYVAANPAAYGLNYSTANYTELDQIRNSFLDDHTLLVVTTGDWNRAGTLGSTGANAWTSLPDGPPYGAVLEKPVGSFANIIAHELGHYLNLQHVSDNGDLMNPIIYESSTHLGANQCEEARLAATYWWQNMLRS